MWDSNSLQRFPDPWPLTCAPLRVQAALPEPTWHWPLTNTPLIFSRLPSPSCHFRWSTQLLQGGLIASTSEEFAPAVFHLPTRHHNTLYSSSSSSCLVSSSWTSNGSQSVTGKKLNFSDLHFAQAKPQSLREECCHRPVDIIWSKICPWAFRK